MFGRKELEKSYSELSVVALTGSGPCTPWFGGYGVRLIGRGERTWGMTSGLMPVTAGCRLARRLDARFGPDRFPARIRAPEPALAHSSGAAE